MNKRLINLIPANLQTKEVISFVKKQLKQTQPSRKGWQDRLIPHLIRQWKNQQVELENETYYASEEYKKRSYFERIEEKEKTLQLEIGESIIYKGAELFQRQGYITRSRHYSHHVTDKGHWIGLSYYSHSEGREADRYFIPEGMKIKVELLHEGCAHSFQVCKITRIGKELSFFQELYIGLYNSFQKEEDRLSTRDVQKLIEKRKLK